MQPASPSLRRGQGRLTERRPASEQSGNRPLTALTLCADDLVEVMCRRRVSFTYVLFQATAESRQPCLTTTQASETRLENPKGSAWPSQDCTALPINTPNRRSPERQPETSQPHSSSAKSIPRKVAKRSHPPFRSYSPSPAPAYGASLSPLPGRIRSAASGIAPSLPRDLRYQVNQMMMANMVTQTTTSWAERRRRGAYGEKYFPAIFGIFFRGVLLVVVGCWVVLTWRLGALSVVGESGYCNAGSRLRERV